MRQRTVTDPDVLKALTHPLRRRLYRLLSQLGPANVRMLSERTGADPGRLSYHLRELARREFIEEVPELARDGRERWWRAVDETWGWTTSELGDPAAQAVGESLYQLGVSEEFQRLRDYESNRAQFGHDWVAAAHSSTTNLRLTPAELTELCEELNATLRRWSADVGRIDQASRPEDRPDDGRTPVFLFFHAFPEQP
ncbi:MAG TPA: helix-turn-helix transcriptional regulator [Streptosporangiaceae bacterium]|jgi:DNA-binding transcriptional ArsR family regulator